MLPVKKLSDTITLSEVRDGYYIVPGATLLSPVTTVAVKPGARVKNGGLSRFRLQMTYRKDLEDVQEGQPTRRDAISLAITAMLPDFGLPSELRTSITEVKYLLDQAGNLEYILRGGQ